MKTRKDGDFHGRTVSLPEGKHFLFSQPLWIPATSQLTIDGASWHADAGNLWGKARDSMAAGQCNFFEFCHFQWHRIGHASLSFEQSLIILYIRICTFIVCRICSGKIQFLFFSV